MSGGRIAERRLREEEQRHENKKGTALGRTEGMGQRNPVPDFFAFQSAGCFLTMVTGLLDCMLEIVLVKWGRQGNYNFPIKFKGGL